MTTADDRKLLGPFDDEHVVDPNDFCDTFALLDGMTVRVVECCERCGRDLDDCWCNDGSSPYDGYRWPRPFGIGHREHDRPVETDR